MGILDIWIKICYKENREMLFELISVFKNWSIYMCYKCYIIGNLYVFVLYEWRKVWLLRLRFWKRLKCFFLCLDLNRWKCDCNEYFCNVILWLICLWKIICFLFDCWGRFRKIWCSVFRLKENYLYVILF